MMKSDKEKNVEIEQNIPKPENRHISFLKSQKLVFLEALLVAALIFGLGFLGGLWIENYRVSKIQVMYTASEINLLDMNIQRSSISSIGCDDAKEELINFAERIYSEAKVLERYEGASRLSDSLILDHKRYDLLRASLLFAIIETENRCNQSFNTVVYLYDYIDAPIETKARQSTFSKYLEELKNKKGSEIILIPIAGDNNLTSVDVILNKFEIDKLPAVLVNYDYKVYSVEGLETIEGQIK
ncbi:hypothetical protein HYW76_05580 [Candidatus Pacearchaeota archaeon]|nr:hypothetical protein [Candidatus Pacearchaeota archaeon]